MTTLFDTTDDTAPAPELASVEAVRLLEGYGYRREAVRLWSREKADTVLGNCRREERRVIARADEKAREQDAAAGLVILRGQPTQGFRDTARVALEQSIAEDTADDLLSALVYSLWVLTDEETREYAQVIVCQLKANVVRPLSAPVESAT